VPTNSHDIRTTRTLTPRSPIEGVSGVSTQPVLTVGLPAGVCPVVTWWQIAAREDFKSLLYDR
jgi:hypothetical protein